MTDTGRDKDRIFDKAELDKLTVLRKNLFRMDISEEILGFKTGSHTVSHYLKGISLKALSYSNWEIDAAAKLITGSNLNGKTETLIKNKINGYMQNLKAKRSNKQENKLYKNLPKEYHKFLVSAIRNID